MIKLDEYFYEDLDVEGIIHVNNKGRETEQVGLLIGHEDKGVVIWFDDKMELSMFVANLEHLLKEDDNADKSADHSGPDSTKNSE